MEKSKRQSYKIVLDGDAYTIEIRDGEIQIYCFPSSPYRLPGRVEFSEAPWKLKSFILDHVR